MASSLLHCARFNIDPVALLTPTVGGSTPSLLPAPGTHPGRGRVERGQPFVDEQPTTYTVKSGDTIYKVACAFGDVDPQHDHRRQRVESPATPSPQAPRSRFHDGGKTSN